MQSLLDFVKSNANAINTFSQLENRREIRSEINTK